MNKKELLLLSIGLFFTIIAWLIADIYHASTTEKVKSNIELPKFKKYVINTDVLKSLDSKTF